MAGNGQGNVYVGVARWQLGEMSGLFRQPVGGTDWERVTKGLPDEVKVQCITVHPGDPSTVYIGTQDGPYRSTDRGASFEKLRFPDSGMQVWSITVHPTRPQTLYAGTSPVAVYRSEDGGDNWRRLADPKMPVRCVMPFDSRVMRIAVDPNRPDEIYATLEVNGAMRSLDGGETWEDCSAGLVDLAAKPHLKSRILSDTDAEGMLDGHALVVSPADPGAVYIAVRMGLFRSPDKGGHWEDMEVGRFSPLTYGRDIRVSPQDPKTLYACLSPAARSEDGSLWKSPDLGKTWSRVDHGVKANSTLMGVALHPSNPDVVHCVSRFGQIFGTTDGGKSWRETRLPEGCQDTYAIACG